MKLSAELAAIVGKNVASRAECIKQLWTYIEKNKLLHPQDEDSFNPDAKMSKVFGIDSVRCLGMEKHIYAHMTVIKKKNSEEEIQSETEIE